MTTPSDRGGGFDRVVERALGTLAALLLFTLMLLTCADVIGRYALNRPVLGAFELTEMGLAALIFAGLPLVTLRQEHITVDLFDAVSPRWLLAIQHVIAQFIGAVAVGYLSWRLWLRGQSMLAAGETTAQLKITLAYLTFAMCFFTALTSIAFVIVMLRRPRQGSSVEI